MQLDLRVLAPNTNKKPKSIEGAIYISESLRPGLRLHLPVVNINRAIELGTRQLITTSNCPALIKNPTFPNFKMIYYFRGLIGLPASAM